MAISRHYVLRFNTDSEDVYKLTVPHADYYAAASVVRSAMNKIRSCGIFETEEKKLISLHSADCITIDREEIEMT